MGLWSFVKGAGKKLIGKDDSPEEAINKELADLGLDAKDVAIFVGVSSSAPRKKYQRYTYA